MTAEETKALRTARSMLDLGHPLDLIIHSGFIPAELQEFIKAEIERDQSFPLVPARTLTTDQPRPDWITTLDRSTWHYWPALRQFLLTTKGLPSSSLRSLDDSSDRILRLLAPPW